MSRTVPQGFAAVTAERISMMERPQMNAAQSQAADELIAGPRKGVKGPFSPLLRSPVLLDRMAKVGEYLRFGGLIEQRINEFVTLVVSRHVSNQFEWFTHHPLALKAGVAAAVLEQLSQGARPAGMAEDEALAYDFAIEILQHHGLADATYARAEQQWGQQGVVELTALVGYFATVSWIMNVARTPARTDDERLPPMAGFPC